jgi:HK97 family phage portal protein
VANPILNLIQRMLPEELVRKSVGAGILVPSRAWQRPNWTEWTTEKGVQEGFNKSEWVKICVDRIATPASSVPWHVSRFSSADAKKQFMWELKSIPTEERSQYIHSMHTLRTPWNRKALYLEPEPDHPLETLIENPNPFLDRQEMIERITQHILLGGNSIITKVRKPDKLNGGTEGPPLELWVQPPDVFTPVPDKRKFILHYEMKIPDQREPLIIPNENLMHFKLPDPSNLYWGASILKAASMTIDMDIEAVKWQKQSLENRAAPDGVFAIQDEIDDTEFEIMRDQMRTQYYGRENARTPMLIGNNAKYYQLSLTPVEMDFINSRKMNREAICALFGVDPRIAGSGSGSGSDMKEIRRVHWTDLVLPYLDRLQSAMTRSLTKEFGGDILLWYDTMNVDALQENFHEKTKSLTLLARNGIPVKAINRRLRLGFYEDELEFLDKGFLPASSRSVENVIKEQENAEAAAAAAAAGQGDQNGGPDGGEPDNPDEGNPAGSPNSDTSQTDEETQKRVQRILEGIREEIKREDLGDDDDSGEPPEDGGG